MAGALVISCWNLQGGQGKSTSASLIASYYSRLGRKVLVCDCDVQQHSSNYFEKYQARYSEEAVVCVSKFGDLGPLIKGVKEDYHVIVIDLPANEGGKLAKSALMYSSLVVCPFGVGQKSINTLFGGTASVIDLVREVRDDLLVVAVPWRLPTTTKSELIELRAVWSTLPDKFLLLDSYVSDRKIFRDIDSTGESLFDGKHEKAFDEATAFCQEIDSILTAKNI